MSRKLTLKTLVSLLAVSVIALPVFAQRARPLEAELPPLRTRLKNENPLRANDVVPAPKAGSTGVNISELPVRGAAGDKTCKPQTGQVDWNWDNVKLADLVTAVSRVTCKSFILSDNTLANKKITILSRTKVTAEQAWQSFMSALESNSMATVKTGAFYKILNTAGGAGIAASAPIQKNNTPIYQKGESVPADEGYVTMIYDVRSISKTLATQLLTEFLKAAPKDVGEFLVFTDTALNVRRAMKALEIVDVPGAANRLHVIDVEFATAKDMKARIEDFFAPPSSGNTGGGLRPRMGGGFEPAASSPDSNSGIKVVADERTNKLIILASDKMYLRIREFIDKLDVRGSGGTSQINIYQLQNQKAADVAKTLQGLSTGSNRSNQPRPAYGAPVAEGAAIEGEFKVQADEKTNSLVITSSRRDFNTLSEVLNKLDRRRPQVYVEAVILEISTNDQEKFGLDFYSLIPSFNIPGLGQIQGVAGNAGGQDLAKRAISSFSSALSTNQAAAQALTLGNFISTLGFVGQSQLNGVQVPGVGAVLNFLTTYGNSEIIATPSLMTVDNEESTIKIGELRPMSSGTTSVPGATAASTAIAGIGTITNNITQQKIENVLKIKPAVKENNEILLEITQDINDVGEAVTIPGAGELNVIRTKHAETRVMASDQQSVVIGGLINKTRVHNETKLPFLGDIPVLGYLFKNTNDSIRYTNLLLVLTPYVIRSPADALKIYERKKREHEDASKLYFGDKITMYNPTIDYNKKPGPIAKMLYEYDTEMLKVENGGSGQAGEIVIKPDEPEVREEVLKGTMPEIPGATTGHQAPSFSPVLPLPAEPYVPPELPVQSLPSVIPPAEGVPPGVTSPAPVPNLTQPAPQPTVPPT